MNWHNFFPLLFRSGPCYYNPNPQLWVFETPAIPRHSENEFKQSYTGVSAATFRFPISINFFPLGVTSSWRRIWDWNFGPVLRTYICLTSRGPNASAEKAFSGGKNFKLVSLFEIQKEKVLPSAVLLFIKVDVSDGTSRTKFHDTHFLLQPRFIRRIKLQVWHPHNSKKKFAPDSWSMVKDVELTKLFLQPDYCNCIHLSDFYNYQVWLVACLVN